VGRLLLEQLRGCLARIYERGAPGTLRAEGLARLAKDLALGSFSSDDIVGLWRIGLLRADLVHTVRPLEAPGVMPLSQGADGSVLQLDSRVIEHRAQGYGGALGQGIQANGEMELWFHPFRAYVLFHVQRTLKVETTDTQYLVYPDGIERVAARIRGELDRWTSSAVFCDRFDHWNLTVELAILCEALWHAPMPGFPGYHAERREAFEGYRTQLTSMIANLGKAEVRTRREELGFDADLLDSNRNVQVLLRLMLQQHLEKLKGPLGGAMQFLSMAEAIRRAAEEALGQMLPEEDEIGPGQWMAGARKMLYGSERVFDAERRDLRDFLSLLGLDFGTKVRCYVEGDTEWGALSHAIASAGHVELVNLAGQVVEKRRKGLAFAEGLANDFNARVFSVIVLDADRDEFVRAVKKAAHEKKFFGRYFLCEPDFELGNFSHRELVDIALELSKVDELDSVAREHRRTRLYAATADMTANSTLWAALDADGVRDVGKGEKWGRALMQFAMQHPRRSDAGEESVEERPLMEAARLVMRTRDAGFMRSLDELELDPLTGRLNPKASSPK
jgi:hypothetical protein